MPPLKGRRPTRMGGLNFERKVRPLPCPCPILNSTKERMQKNRLITAKRQPLIRPRRNRPEKIRLCLNLLEREKPRRSSTFHLKKSGYLSTGGPWKSVSVNVP